MENIKNSYYKIFNKSLSKMTISRILRCRLNIRFMKTIVKNPKLEKKEYIFMKHLFIKCISKSINNGLKFIFLDESGFKLENNNYFAWRKKNEDLTGGATKGLKIKLNLILAINDSKIIHYYLTYDPINQANFPIFLEEMKNKIEPIESKNYIIILDNARFHPPKKTINFVEDNKMKV